MKAGLAGYSDKDQAKEDSLIVITDRTPGTADHTRARWQYYIYRSIQRPSAYVQVGPANLDYVDRRNIEHSMHRNADNNLSL